MESAIDNHAFLETFESQYPKVFQTISNKKLLYSYINGNVLVGIYDDGTKIRITPKDEPEQIVLPESFDCKITNWCDGTLENTPNQCLWCHERSNIHGKHADIKRLLEVTKNTLVGQEWAIGGGETLSHPDVITLLNEIKNRKQIANITINQKHIERRFDVIEHILNNDLVKGIGISYSDKTYFPHIRQVLNKTNNVVFHLIVGINLLKDILDLKELCAEQNKPCKILLLGYKKFGLGLKHFQENENDITKQLKLWKNHFPRVFLDFRYKQVVYAFDNLAIQQLNIKSLVSPEVWQLNYQGEEFTNTMYIDAVNQQFAPTSCAPFSDRKSFNDYSLVDYFKNFKHD